ncbi:MAG: hypothetical protein MHM6MM_004952 [Cercozoa sp. M6MM]
MKLLHGVVSLAALLGSVTANTSTQSTSIVRGEGMPVQSRAMMSFVEPKSVVEDEWQFLKGPDYVELLAAEFDLDLASAIVDPSKRLTVEVASLTLRGKQNFRCNALHDKGELGKIPQVTDVRIVAHSLVIGEGGVEIDVSAVDNDPQLPPAHNGVDFGEHGHAGKDGKAGLNGCRVEIHALHVKRENDKSDDVVRVISRGQNGQMGQHGGNGAAGAPGRAGVCKCNGDPNGGAGGAGGNAGAGGNGGAGGKGGDIVIKVPQEDALEYFQVLSDGGEPGVGGVPGAAAPGGPGGAGGDSKCKKKTFGGRKCKGPRAPNGPAGPNGAPAAAGAPASKGETGLMDKTVVPLEDFRDEMSVEVLWMVQHAAQRAFILGHVDTAAQLFGEIATFTAPGSQLKSKEGDLEGDSWAVSMLHSTATSELGKLSSLLNPWGNRWDHIYLLGLSELKSSIRDLASQTTAIETEYRRLLDDALDSKYIVEHGSMIVQQAHAQIARYREDIVHSRADIDTTREELSEAQWQQTQQLQELEGSKSACEAAINNYFAKQASKLSFKKVLGITMSAVSLFTGFGTVGVALGGMLQATKAMKWQGFKQDTFVDNWELIRAPANDFKGGWQNIEAGWQGLRDPSTHADKMLADFDYASLMKWDFLPDCATTQELLDDFRRICEKVNDLILTHDALQVRVAVATQQIAELEQAADETRTSVTANHDPNLAALTRTTGLVLRSNKMRLVRLLYAYHKNIRMPQLDQRDFAVDYSRVAMMLDTLASIEVDALFYQDEVGGRMATFNKPASLSLVRDVASVAGLVTSANAKQHANAFEFDLSQMSYVSAHSFKAGAPLVLQIDASSRPVLGKSRVRIKSVNAVVMSPLPTAFRTATGTCSKILVHATHDGFSRIWSDDGRVQSFTHTPVVFPFEIDLRDGTVRALRDIPDGVPLSPLGGWTIEVPQEANCVSLNDVEKIYLDMTLEYIPCSHFPCSFQQVSDAASILPLPVIGDDDDDSADVPPPPPSDGRDDELPPPVQPPATEPPQSPSTRRLYYVAAGAVVIMLVATLTAMCARRSRQSQQHDKIVDIDELERVQFGSPRLVTIDA